MKITAVYARVSSDRQRHENQHPDLERWLAVYAPDDNVKWFTDNFTGRATSRPGWDQVQTLLEQNQLHRLVVWSVERIGRRAAWLSNLFDTLKERGVHFVSVRDGINGLDTPAGMLVASVLAALGQYENELKSERVRAGMARRKAEGKPVNGNHKRRGELRAVPRSKLPLFYKLVDDGIPKSEIARMMGVSRSQVYNLIRRRASFALPTD